MNAPEACLYCDGTSAECGFCVDGIPLDTPSDWDRSWGHVMRRVIEQRIGRASLSDGGTQ